MASGEREVTIIRAGYATEALWVTAIRQAHGFGRTGVAIDAEGQVIDLAEAVKRYADGRGR